MELQLPYINVFDVIGWRNLAVYPTLEQRRKYICLEYVAELEVVLLEWVNNVTKQNTKDRVGFAAVIVFADYNKLTSGKITDLVTDFVSIDAAFYNFPEGCQTFVDALLSYNETVQNAKLHNENSATDREKLLAKI